MLMHVFFFSLAKQLLGSFLTKNQALNNYIIPVISYIYTDNALVVDGLVVYTPYIDKIDKSLTF